MLKRYSNSYKNEDLDKFSYMDKMDERHKILYEYADFYDCTKVSNISIRNGEVYYTILSGDISIEMVRIHHDITSVPSNFLAFDSYDAIETRILNEIIEDKDVIFDIGANIGWYTINWAKGKKAKVYSFEAMPDNHTALCTNLTLNGLSTEHAYNYALSNKNGHANFYFDIDRCGASSMVNLRDTDKVSIIERPIRKLDTVCEALDFNKLDFIKIDVEGAEKLVFEGGINTIEKYKPIIYSEMLRKWSKKFNYHPDDIIKLLSNIGYNCYGFVNNKFETVNAISDQIETTNFFFMIPEKHSKYIKRLVDFE